jgi:hypothetical protein
MQQFLKTVTGFAGARIVTTELLNELLISVDKPTPALHMRLGGEPFASLSSDLKSPPSVQIRLVFSWHTFLSAVTAIHRWQPASG